MEEGEEEGEEEGVRVTVQHNNSLIPKLSLHMCTQLLWVMTVDPPGNLCYQIDDL